MSGSTEANDWRAERLSFISNHNQQDRVGGASNDDGVKVSVRMGVVQNVGLPLGDNTNRAQHTQKYRRLLKIFPLEPNEKAVVLQVFEFSSVLIGTKELLWHWQRWYSAASSFFLPCHFILYRHAWCSKVTLWSSYRSLTIRVSYSWLVCDQILVPLRWLPCWK